MKLDGLLQIAWLLANTEAKHLGSLEIEPIHFLLAAMKIIDPEFPEVLEKLDMPSDNWARMCKEAKDIRCYIDVLPDRVTTKRRSLRAILVKQRVKAPITEEGMLHRSSLLKRAFADAIYCSKEEELSLYQLVRSLFELKLVCIDQVDAKKGG